MAIATVNVVVPGRRRRSVVDISSLVGSKTVILTGFFSGSYTLLVSNDGVHYAPRSALQLRRAREHRATLKDAYQFALCALMRTQCPPALSPAT